MLTRDEIKKFNSTPLDTKIQKPEELPSERNNNCNVAVVDIAKRDTGNGQFDIDIIVYRRPDVRREQLEPAIKVACINVFGNDKNNLDLYYRDEMKIAQEIRSDYKRLATPLQPVDSWGIDIKWPRSIYYTDLEYLRNRFCDVLMKAFNA